jgi:hypothetical protein
MYHTIEQEIHIPHHRARFRLKIGVIPTLVAVPLPVACSPSAGFAEPPTFNFVA